MSDFVVSARKYRPSTFDSVVGQEALTTTLKNAILQNKLSHAYLFCGPRGVGKTSCARIFAKTINCQNRTPEGEACNRCESCVAANEQRSYNIMELDAASNNSVNDIRQLIEQVYIAPTNSKYRIYIIDEVHMLSSSAFNAFLKTLEEPPAHAIFILATTEKHKVLPTIISRCQVHDFNRITSQAIADHLYRIATNEGIEAEPDALQMIGIVADGGMRDALSMFDQIAGFGGGRITVEGVRQNLNLLDEDEYFKLLAYIIKGNHIQVLTLINELIHRGYESDIIIRGFSTFLRNVLLAQSQETVPLINAPVSIVNRMMKAGAYTPTNLLWLYLKESSSFGMKYKNSSDKRLALEVALLKMCELGGNGSLNNSLTNNEPTNLAPTPESHNNATASQVSQPTQVYTKPILPKHQPTKPKGNNAQNLYGFSMKTGKAVAEDDSDKPMDSTERVEPYSEADLQRAWRKVVSQLKAPLLKPYLERQEPQKNDDHRINLLAKSNTQKRQILEVVDQLLTALRDELKNDRIEFSIDVDIQQQESGPVTPAEKWQALSEKNPWLQAMANDLGLRAI